MKPAILTSALDSLWTPHFGQYAQPSADRLLLTKLPPNPAAAEVCSPAGPPLLALELCTGAGIGAAGMEQVVGELCLDLLLEHFGKRKLSLAFRRDPQPVEPYVNAIECRMELDALVTTFHAELKDRSMTQQECWQRVLTRSGHQEMMPSMIKLVRAMLVQPVTAVPREQGFSTMARLKTKMRNRLQSEQLRVVMRIAADKEARPREAREATVVKAVKLFMSMKHRRNVHSVSN